MIKIFFKLKLVSILFLILDRSAINNKIPNIKVVHAITFKFLKFSISPDV